MGLIKIKVKKKVKKDKYKYSKFEIAFDILSIAIVIGVGLYFGGRALYYYSKQNVKRQVEAQTLNGLVLNNNKIVEGDGLHQDSNGYYFKGSEPNNYVMFSNRLYRVIRVNNDNTVRLISEDVVSSFMWGDALRYEESNVRNWLTKTDTNHSGIYYDTIPNNNEFLVHTNYRIDMLSNEKIEFADQDKKDYVSTLTLEDYILAGGKSSYLNNGKVFYLLGIDEDENYLYVEEDGSIQTMDNYTGYGIRPVITLKENITVSSGDGSRDNPFVLLQDGKTNYIDTYVKLGNDIWRVYQEENDAIRLYLNDYVKTPEGVEVNRSYSDYNSVFDVSDRGSLAFYLNNIYISGLSYKDILLDTNFYIGEISNEYGYSLENIYTRNVTLKVGLLNIFDYHRNYDKENYFYMNITSEVGNMQYTTNTLGLLLEEDVREERHMIPVISIKTETIKGGTGTLDSPFVIE